MNNLQYRTCDYGISVGAAYSLNIFAAVNVHLKHNVGTQECRPRFWLSAALCTLRFIALSFFFLIKIKFQKLCKAVYNHDLPFLRSALGPKKDVRSAGYPKIQSTHSVCLSISVI